MLEERHRMHPHIVENPKILSMEIALRTTLAHRIEPIRSSNMEFRRLSPQSSILYCAVKLLHTGGIHSDRAVSCLCPHLDF